MAKVITLLICAIPEIKMWILHHNKLETAKTSALEKEKGTFDKWMAIIYEMKTSLIWWINNFAMQDRQCFRTVTEINLYTDGSCLGWGSYLHHQQ